MAFFIRSQNSNYNSYSEEESTNVSRSTQNKERDCDFIFVSHSCPWAFLLRLCFGCGLYYNLLTFLLLTFRRVK